MEYPVEASGELASGEEEGGECEEGEGCGGGFGDGLGVEAVDSEDAGAVAFEVEGVDGG